MNNRVFICGGPLFDGHNLFEKGGVLLNDGLVEKIVTEDTCDTFGAEIINTCDNLIMPGIIDLHSDSLERNIEKRKGVFFDIDFAILNLDRQLASCGITTFFHAISFADNELGLRAPKEAEKCVRKIKAFNDKKQKLINHRTHARYEVGSDESYRIITKLIGEKLIDIISIMDHTPGQGQFKSIESYLKFHSNEYEIEDHEILKKAEEKQKKNKTAWSLVKDLVEKAGKAGIPVLSHDDDTERKVDLINSIGVKASEFPVTMAAARKAYLTGLDIFMGAPNLIRGESTNGNLKAAEAISNGFCTGLVSDYYPESLLQSAFLDLMNRNNLEKSLSLITSGPGSFLCRPEKTGCISEGGDGDIIIVDIKNRWAHVTETFVKGVCKYRVK